MPLFILIFCLFNSYTKPVLAVTATPSADKTQDIVNLVQEKVKEKLNLITSPSTQPKSFVGNITQISDTQISISFLNITKNISIGDSTVYIDSKKNNLFSKYLLQSGSLPICL